jgi:hypothetical protein
MKKKIAGLALIAVFALTGCSVQGQTVNQGYEGGVGTFEEFTYVHSNGKKLDCLKHDRGITCDWNSKH